MTFLWLLRWWHVLSAALWLGGYAFLAGWGIPALRCQQESYLQALCLNLVRTLTYLGLSTMVSGFFLVQFTRGFRQVNWWGQWGLVIMAGMMVATLVMGLGDGVIRPRLRQGRYDARLQYWVWGVLFLLVLVLGLMTATHFVRS